MGSIKIRPPSMQHSNDPPSSDNSAEVSKFSNKRINFGDSQKKAQENIRFIDTPLQCNLKYYISQIVDGKDYEKILEIVEEVAEIEIGDSLYNKLVEKLRSFHEDEESTTKLVGQILFYKSRPCKNAINCEQISECVFIHDSSKEVVVNHIDSPDCDLQGYFSGFGHITSIKRIGRRKYLVTFRNESDAIKFMKDRDPVLGKNYITKFFNKKSSNYNSLIAEQENLIQKIYDQGNNKKIAVKMTICIKKLKNAISDISYKD